MEVNLSFTQQVRLVVLSRPTRLQLLLPAASLLLMLLLASLVTPPPLAVARFFSESAAIHKDCVCLKKWPIFLINLFKKSTSQRTTFVIDI